MIIKNKIHYIILNYDRFKMHFFIFEFFYSFLHIKILFFKTLSPLSVSKMVLYGELLSRRLLSVLDLASRALRDAKKDANRDA